MTNHKLEMLSKRYFTPLSTIITRRDLKMVQATPKNLHIQSVVWCKLHLKNHQFFFVLQVPYNFAYGVKDDYKGTDFSQNEESDGKTVKGSYTVLLPDGRKQTVRQKQVLSSEIFQDKPWEKVVLKNFTASFPAGELRRWRLWRFPGWS